MHYIILSLAKNDCRLSCTRRIEFFGSFLFSLGARWR